MPELLLELFSEEIPARMQARGAEDLSRLVAEALASLEPVHLDVFSGPRRIALIAMVAAEVPETRGSERGPRVNAPEQALAGFLRKHAAAREQLRQEGDFWILDKIAAGIDASALIAREMPGLLRRFPWPKSMRWGGTSAFTWVRPLRRILCVLDGVVVPFDLRDGADDGHGLTSSNVTEGHRFLAPEAFAVASASVWQKELRERYVVPQAIEREVRILNGLSKLAAGRNLALVDDAGLLSEVVGLVEWPVPLLGVIDPEYMNLPAEVMQVSMRVNQRYFALRDTSGHPAPFFAFVANIDAPDGGATIIEGNERVLRARFADARHFWDLDRAQPLENRVPALDGVTFHAKLGSQGDRVRRLVHLASVIAPLIKVNPELAKQAARLAKADLTTGMVGEFPELQGVVGGYLAQHFGLEPAIQFAIHDHYAPKGPSDSLPRDPVGVVVALADKIDTLAAFFAIGERPTGSGDPFALRRAALGIVRMVFERALHLPLRRVFEQASEMLPVRPDVGDLIDFIAERARILLRGENMRHDVLAAVFATGAPDDLLVFRTRAEAVEQLLGTEDGNNLLAAYKRATNILRIENKKDGPHDGRTDTNLLESREELALADTLQLVQSDVALLIGTDDYVGAMETLASLRPPLDAFFERVTVNDPRPELRRNRLRLLSRVRATMHLAADFSQIDG